MPSPHPAHSHLPPRLREVCDILALGLLRLRSRKADEAARTNAQDRERLLHFWLIQRRYTARKGRAVI